MSGSGDLVRRSAQEAELEQARGELTWVGDDALIELEEVSPAGAAALSFFLGGAGQLYVRDWVRGGAFVALWVLLLTLVGYGIPGASAVMLIGCVGSALHAFREAEQVNTYLEAKRAFYRDSSVPASMQLLKAMGRAPAMLPPPETQASEEAAPPDSPVGQIRERLRKQAVLRNKGIIEATEYQNRKVDTLTEILEIDEPLEDILFALLPLVEEGVLTQEDVSFIKEIGVG